MAIRMSGIVSNMDTDSIIKELMKAQSAKKTSIENKKTKLEWKQDIWKDLNKKIYKFYTDSVSKMKLEKSYNTKSVTTTDPTVATVTSDNSATNGTHSLTVSKLASSEYVTGAKKTGLTSSTKLARDLNNDGVSDTFSVGSTLYFQTGTKAPTTLEVTASTTIQNYIDTAKKAGLNATFDETQGRFFVSSPVSGADNSFILTAYKADNSVDTAGLSSIGLAEIKPADFVGATDGDTATNISNFYTNTGVSYVAGQDASIILDGAAMTSSTNSITAAGLTLNLNKQTSVGQSVGITVANDVESTYKMVKSFITDYNALLKEMNGLYDAATAKGYSPLTDDQKESMTDDQIEKWETKIKDSLLRRDDKLSGLINTLKTNMAFGVKISNKDYSLSTYGIMTSTDYTEKGLLHIYGDTDDITYSDKKDKLKAAIKDNPDQVMEVLTGIAKNLNDTMFKKMKSSSLNSALTFYNDKEIKKQVDSYKDQIKSQEKRLTEMENRYYKKFTAMETAMAKLNSQTSSLSSLFGSSN